MVVRYLRMKDRSATGGFFGGRLAAAAGATRCGLRGFAFVLAQTLALLSYAFTDAQAQVSAASLTPDPSTLTFWEYGEDREFTVNTVPAGETVDIVANPRGTPVRVGGVVPFRSVPGLTCPGRQNYRTRRQDGDTVYLTGCAPGPGTVQLQARDGTVLNTYTLPIREASLSPDPSTLTLPPDGSWHRFTVNVSEPVTVKNGSLYNRNTMLHPVESLNVAAAGTAGGGCPASGDSAVDVAGGQDIQVAACVEGAGHVDFFLASDGSFVRSVYFLIPSATCLFDLGTLSGTRTVSGEWNSGCRSFHDYRYDQEARYYTFSLASAADVQMDLMPRTDLTPQTSRARYSLSALHLLEGAEIAGRVLESNVAYASHGSVNSRIEAKLQAGTYTIDASAAYCCGEKPDLRFRLSLTVGDGPPPPPPPPPGFTDDPIIAGTTVVKAIHVNELRARIDAVRGARRLSTYPWTDQPVRPGVTPVKAVHLSEMRTALDQAYDAAGQPRFSYAETATSGAAIRTVHIRELRMAVTALQ